MEEGRAANLLRVFGGFVTLKLSSGAVEDPLNSAAVTIGPVPSFPPDVVALVIWSVHGRIGRFIGELIILVVNLSFQW
jgi:hypothetical protein